MVGTAIQRASVTDAISFFLVLAAALAGRDTPSLDRSQSLSRVRSSSGDTTGTSANPDHRSNSGGYSGLFAAGARVLAFVISLVMLVTDLGRKIR